MADRDLDEIRREVEQARTQLAATVDALAERLNPARIIASLKARVLAMLREPIVITAVTVVCLLALLLMVRKRRR